MSKIFKKALAIELCIIFMFGTVAIGSDGVAKLFEMISFKASAEDNYKYINCGSAFKDQYTLEEHLNQVCSSSDTFTLTYDSNGGDRVPYPQSGNGNIIISNELPKRDNYTFQGWATSANATSAQYMPCFSFNLTENTTLYAVWKEGSLYICPYCESTFVTQDCFYDHIWTYHIFALTYDANGGIGEPDVQYGNGIIALSDARPIRALINAGYDFLGWATSADAATAQYQPSDIFNLTENTTLYAVWGKNNPTAEAKLNVCSSATVDYKANVTVTATATGVPDGYLLAIYEGNYLRALGNNMIVSYNAGTITANRTFTVKVIEKNGNIQKDESGNDLTAKCEVNVKSSFIDKLIAFFKGLFGALPNVEVKP